MMRMTVFAILAVLLHPDVHGQDGPMRCGNRLVDTGDTRYTVLEACGAPTSTYGSVWIYDQGAGTLLRIVRFYQDEVQAIELGDRRQELEVPGRSRIFPAE